MKKILLMTAALALVALPSAALAADAMATPGKALNMVLLPKFSGNAVFDQAHDGALEAAEGAAEPDRAAVPRAAGVRTPPARSTSSPTPPPRASTRS